MTDTPPPGAEPGAPPSTPPSTSTDVSANIRAELARRRLTARDAQKAMKISSTTWDARMREPGYWRLGQLERLAGWLGVDVETLLRGAR